MDKKQSILFKVNRFPRLSETFIVAQLVTAKKLGFEVHLLVNTILEEEKVLYEKEINDFELLNNVIIDKYEIPKNKLIRLLRWIVLLIKNIRNINYIIKYYNLYAKFSLTYLFQWNFYKQLNNFDIIHIQFGNHKSPIDKLKKIGFLKSATILTFHGHDAFFPMYGRIPNNGYYDFFFKFGDLVTVNTPYLENEVKRLGCPQEKLKIIPVSVDTNFFRPSNNSKFHKLKDNDSALNLINVGRLDKIKGQKYLIEVVLGLLKLDRKVKLTIIGEGEEYEYLNQIIIRNKLTDVITLAGKKTQTEIREAFQYHDIYVFTPIALEDGRSETQGLATLEAQAMGLPVVVFDSGGVKYTVKNNFTGYVCSPQNVNCVINKIKHLYDHPGERKEMGREARNFVKENYSDTKLLNKWGLIYNSLLNKSH